MSESGTEFKLKTPPEDGITNEGGELGPEGEFVWLTKTGEKADQPVHGQG